MAKNILKEAIADAKAVREVALANAKAALEEAFTPRLQSMLSAKLSEELDEGEDKEEIEETYMEDKEEMDENMNEDEKEDLDEEIDLEEILSELELDEGDDSKEETVEEAKDTDEETMDEAKDEEEEKIDEMQVNYSAETANRAGYAADYVHEGTESFNLDALLEEINNLDENEEEDVNEGRFGEEAESQNEVLGTAAIGVSALVAAAGGLSAIENAAEDPAFQAKYPKVARALKTLQGMGKAAADTKRNEEVARDEELSETRAALESIRTELNEVNLLNSKLLYVNRIFKANTLDEGQKLRVVETLDKAETAKEAKLIYETIKDSFGIARSEKASKKVKSLKEGFRGMASRAAGTSTAPKKPVLNESNDMMKRFQTLANIKIK